MSDKRKATPAAGQTQELKPSENLTLNDRQDIEHPSFYADQLSALAIGPFVSKFTIAAENHSLKARVPVVSVTMPTNTLYLMAKVLVETIEKGDHEGKMSAAVQQFHDSMKSI